MTRRARAALAGAVGLAVLAATGCASDWPRAAAYDGLQARECITRMGESDPHPDACRETSYQEYRDARRAHLDTGQRAEPPPLEPGRAGGADDATALGRSLAEREGRALERDAREGSRASDHDTRAPAP